MSLGADEVVEPASSAQTRPSATGEQRDPRESRGRRILYLTSSREYGGAERYLADVVERFSRASGEAILVCPDPGIFPRREAIERARIVRLDPASFSQVLRLRALYREFRPDVVHFNLHAPWACAAAVLAAEGVVPRGRRVATVHNVLAARSRAPFVGGARTRLAARLLRRLAVVMCASHAGRARLAAIHGLDEEAIEVIPYGVDAPPDVAAAGASRRDPRREGGALVVGAVTRLARDKGLPTLLAAVALLANGAPNFRLVVVGGGTMRVELERLAHRMGIADRLEWRGFREDPLAETRGFDVFVHPSDWETFGYAILEAMSLAKPVVATSVGGVPELTGADAAVLVPPGDAEAMAGALAGLLEDRSLREKLGERGRARAARFPLERMLAEVEALYALAARGARAG